MSPWQRARMNLVERARSLRFRIKALWEDVTEIYWNFFWWVVQHGARLLGKSIAGGVDSVFRGEPRPRSFPFRLLRGVIGLILAVFAFVAVQIVIFGFGIVGNLVGLRSGKEYSVFENLIAWLPIVVLFIYLPYAITNDYYISQLSMALSYAIVILGLNILMGVAGQLSLGHGAFVLIGAYTMGFLQGKEVFGVAIPAPVSILAGGVGAAFVGMLVGIPAVRVKGPYLGLITLGLALCVPNIIRLKPVDNIIHGYEGITIAVPSAPASMPFLTDAKYFYIHVLFFFVALLIFAHILLRRTKVGRAFVMMRETEERASLLGINVFVYKILAFTVAAFYAGIGGGLFGLLTGFVSPNSFTLQSSLDFLAATVIGGLGSIFGSVVGGFFLGYQDQFGSFLAKFVKDGEQLRFVIYGGFLLFIMIAMPKGIVGEIGHKFFKWFFQLPRRRAHRHVPPPDYEIDEEYSDLKNLL